MRFVLALVAVTMSTAGATSAAPAVGSPVWLSSSGPRFAGDHTSLATISPDRDGYRDVLRVHVRLARPTTVRLIIRATRYRQRTIVDRRTRLAAGRRTLFWAPGPAVRARTYNVTVSSAGGSLTTRPLVVRVLGLDASFTRESYRPNTVASMTLESDESELTLRVLRAGAADGRETVNPVRGVAVTEPVTLHRTDRRDGPRIVRTWVGEWPPGLYFAELTAPDGRRGYAPFIVRASRLDATTRVAVVLPTYTWQAYNFRDTDGSGDGDTWYATPGRDITRLRRPYLDRGLPPFFQSYDLPFLRWLARAERKGWIRAPDFLSDEDLAAVRSGDRLARVYDLLVFPGHHEYVTKREYDVVERFRDRGGSLMFLSANNFFWHVERRGPTLRRLARWRMVGRPEASLVGVQYLTNDLGERRAPFVLRRSPHLRWLVAGTRLRPGSRFGRFGIEIDSMAAGSPPGTVVLAEIPHLFGPGVTAQMTYYETRRGARVFAAGAFTLAGYALYEPVSTMLWNVWGRLTSGSAVSGMRTRTVRQQFGRAKLR